eukprot:scaffold80687_cov49-Cyclotella_meneghiniana.AAC.3
MQFIFHCHCCFSGLRFAPGSLWMPWPWFVTIEWAHERADFRDSGARPQQHLEDMWSHREHLEFFDGSYLAGNPQTWAEQQLGLACCVTHCHTPGTTHPTILQKNHILQRQRIYCGFDTVT